MQGCCFGAQGSRFGWAFGGLRPWAKRSHHRMRSSWDAAQPLDAPRGLRTSVPFGSRGVMILLRPSFWGAYYFATSSQSAECLETPGSQAQNLETDGSPTVWIGSTFLQSGSYAPLVWAPKLEWLQTHHNTMIDHLHNRGPYFISLLKKARGPCQGP